MARKCQSHKLANFFCILVVALVAVHAMFWSSNTGVMALRDLPMEMDIFEKILLPDLTIKSCGYKCKTDEDCKPLTFCSVCKWSIKGRLACVLSLTAT